MRPPLAAAAALLLAATAAGAADFTIGGHAKVQSAFELFRDNDLAALAAGKHPADAAADLRLNTVTRSSSFDLTASLQVIATAGDTVRAHNDPRLGGFGSYLLGIPDPTDAHQWFGLTRTLTDTGSRLAFARLDRLSAGFTGDHLVLRLGRQAVSWGDGLVFQVLDLFNPFPPTALDTEYKPGSDMVFAQWLAGSGDDVQALVVPRRAGKGQPLEESQSSAALKWHHLIGGTELQVMAARPYEDTVSGLGASANVAGGVWRLDLAYTDLAHGGSATSLVTNLDRSWVWRGRNWYGFVEFFRNGFGLSSLDGGVGALPVPLLARLERGELSTLGRDELGLGARVEWTPRFTVEPTIITNLRDGSSLALVKLRFDWLQNLQLDAGVQASWGSRGTEYGGLAALKRTGYLSPGQRIWIRLSRYF